MIKDGFYKVDYKDEFGFLDSIIVKASNFDELCAYLHVDFLFASKNVIGVEPVSIYNWKE